MRRTTSFTLGKEQEAFIDAQLENGSYDSASELVRDAVASLADEKRKEALWRASIEHGMASGRAKPGVFARVRKKTTRR